MIFIISFTKVFKFDFYYNKKEFYNFVQRKNLAFIKNKFTILSTKMNFVQLLLKTEFKKKGIAILYIYLKKKGHCNLIFILKNDFYNFPKETLTNLFTKIFQSPF